MSTTKERTAPPGFHLEWVPSDEWTTDPESIAGKQCRFGVGAKRCVERAVAALLRGRGGRPQGWCYCSQHLYGRRSRAGVVEHQRVVQDEEV